MSGNGNGDPMDIPEGAPSPYQDPEGDEKYENRWPSAHAEGPNAYGPVERLPGITSGPAPKPWGLNRDQPTYADQPAYGPGGRSQGYLGTLQRVRPMDPGSDLRMRNAQKQQGQFKIPGGGVGKTPRPGPSASGRISPDTKENLSDTPWLDPRDQAI